MFATGENIGRGIVFLAKWRESSGQSANGQKQSGSKLSFQLIFRLKIIKKLVIVILRYMLTPPLVRYTNGAFYYYHLLRNWKAKPKTTSYHKYCFPHSFVPESNKIFAPFGVVEYQIMFPARCVDKAIRELITLFQSENTTSIMGIIKRHKADDLDFSFSGEGYSICIDLPVSSYTKDNISQFTRRLTQLMAKFDGKFYIAKDLDFRKDALQSSYGLDIPLKTYRKDTGAYRLFSSHAAKRLID